MDVKETITDKDGKQKTVKVQMPSVGRILEAVKQSGLFVGITRYQYLQYDVEEALKIVEAIGKSRNPKFVIDDEHRLTYENFIKWCHCDTSMQCLDPDTRQVVPGHLKRGIYIAGNTGSGKSWCLEIMLAYSAAWGFRVSMEKDNNTTRPLWWVTFRADEICDKFIEDGNIQRYKSQGILGIQDLGSEPQESMYMGNRLDVLRNVLEYRGDKTDELTLITSNLKINGEALSNRYGDRVASRLREMCNYFEIKGKDRRKI